MSSTTMSFSRLFAVLIIYGIAVIEHSAVVAQDPILTMVPSSVASPGGETTMGGQTIGGGDSINPNINGVTTGNANDNGQGQTITTGNNNNINIITVTTGIGGSESIISNSNVNNDNYNSQVWSSSVENTVVDSSLAMVPTPAPAPVPVPTVSPAPTETDPPTVFTESSTEPSVEPSAEPSGTTTSVGLQFVVGAKGAITDIDTMERHVLAATVRAIGGTRRKLLTTGRTTVNGTLVSLFADTLTVPSGVNCCLSDPSDPTSLYECVTVYLVLSEFVPNNDVQVLVEKVKSSIIAGTFFNAAGDDEQAVLTCDDDTSGPSLSPIVESSSTISRHPTKEQKSGGVRGTTTGLLPNNAHDPLP